MDKSQSKGPNIFCLYFEHNIHVVLLLKNFFLRILKKKKILLYTFLFMKWHSYMDVDVAKMYKTHFGATVIR